MRRIVLLLAILVAAPPASAWVAILPGAVEGLGQAPAVFSSTLFLSNLGPRDVNVTFRFIPYADGRVADPVARTIQSRGSMTIPQALKTLFGLQADAGTILVSSEAPLAGSIVTANVANPQATYGVALAPVTDRDLLLPGSVGHAPWVSQGGGFRTNVAAVLVDPDSAVTVKVFDEGGALVGSRELASLTPVSFQAPVTDLIGPRDLAVGRVEFSVTKGRVAGYTVVNDNVTGDGIAIQAPRVLSSNQILNGVAKVTGERGTFWRTDARVFNPGANALDITVEPIGLPTGTPIHLNVPGRGILDLPDVLSRFGVGAPAAGALRFFAGQEFLVFGRTQNVDPTGQRPGTFAASQRAVLVPNQILVPGQTGSFPGVEQSAYFRSNLALLGTETGAIGILVLRGPTGADLASTSFNLQPNQWIQNSIPGWFPGITLPSAARVDVVLSGGGLDGYLSRIDNTTGDSVILPVSIPRVAESELRMTAFAQSPDPIKSNVGGTLAVNLQNSGPDSTEGSLELVLNVMVTQGSDKLVVTGFAGSSGSEWTLVNGTFGVSQNVRLRRNSFMPPDTTTSVQVKVGVPGGAAVGGPFAGNRATVSVPSDLTPSNNERTITINMTP